MISPNEFHAGFGAQFAQGRLVQFLAGVDEAAGQRPVARVGQFAALHKQDVQFPGMHGEGGDVHGQPDLRGAAGQREVGHARSGWAQVG